MPTLIKQETTYSKITNRYEVEFKGKRYAVFISVENDAEFDQYDVDEEIIELANPKAEIEEEVREPIIELIRGL